jgi:hypothetical protein
VYRLSCTSEAQYVRREINLMICHICGSRPSGLAPLAVVAVGLWAAAAEAAVIAFRNETDGPIMVQGISIINRVARRGKLHVLRPGEVAGELILVPGTRLIIIADAKQPTRILCQEIIQFTGTDLFYAIQRDEPDKAKEGEDAKAKGRKMLLPKVKLVPSKPTPPITLPPSKSHP